MGLFFLKSSPCQVVRGNARAHGHCLRVVGSSGGHQAIPPSATYQALHRLHRVQELEPEVHPPLDPKRDLQYFSLAVQTTGGQKNNATTLKPQHSFSSTTALQEPRGHRAEPRSSAWLKQQIPTPQLHPPSSTPDSLQGSVTAELNPRCDPAAPKVAFSKKTTEVYPYLLNPCIHKRFCF